MQVRDLMSTNLVTLDVHAHIDLAEGLMSLMRIRHLPVVDGARFAGLVTHRDLLRASLRSALRGSRVPVRELMRIDVTTCGPDADVRDVVEVMLGHKYGCVPVVENGGRLVGLVTESDLMRLTAVLLSRVDDDALPADHRLLLDRHRE
jgi:CBS domain-containing membrane protein